MQPIIFQLCAIGCLQLDWPCLQLQNWHYIFFGLYDCAQLMVHIWVIIINIHRLIHLMVCIWVSITNIHKLIYYKTNKNVVH